LGLEKRREKPSQMRVLHWRGDSLKSVEITSPAGTYSSNPLQTVDSKYQAQFQMAAMTLKALEDKTYRGAMIASPSIPWGGGPNANEATISGYHAVWARDLYQVATAFLALGDDASANRALDYLFDVQQKADGSFSAELLGRWPADRRWLAA
jgi:GH15 family glucan-1,4-alpha-glucosidase